MPPHISRTIILPLHPPQPAQVLLVSALEHILVTGRVVRVHEWMERIMAVGDFGQ